MITNPALKNNIGNFANSTDSTGALSKLLQTGIALAFGVGGIILFLMLIMGGYEYLTAGGDKEATEKAKKRLTNSLIGIVILFSVYAILAVIGIVFGLSLTSITIPRI